MVKFERYRGFGIEIQFAALWSAYIYKPGAHKPYEVVVRAGEEEGATVLKKRARLLIDVLVLEMLRAKSPA